MFLNQDLENPERVLKEKRSFLFRCESCQVILLMDFQSKEDLEDIQEDKIYLECPCKHKCYVLRN